MTIAIRLPDNLEQELAATAKKMKRSKSFIVREAITHYLEDINDYYAGIEALEKTMRIYSSIEARKELGLGD